MDLSHVHDNMDIANSPYPQVDDIDLDFDNVRQQSIDRSMADDTDFMQADIADMYNDDDMLDDEALQPPQNNPDDLEDLNMEALDQDDQILYDDEVEEAASVDMAEQHDSTFAETSIPDIENAEHSSHVTEELGEDVYREQDEDNTNTVEIDQKDVPDQNNTAIDPEEHLPDEEVNQAPIDAIDVVDFAEQEHDELQDEQLKAVQPPLVEDEQIPVFGLQDAHPDSLVAETQEGQPLESSAAPANEATAHEDATADATNLSISVEQSGASRQTAESLHPITIVYLGQEMSLFPPMVDDSSATFFVSDLSLAYEPVGNLLAGCREILGQSLEHDDELVLDVPALGLHICEDSDFAAQLTLSQVVEVYLALCRNESVENIDPLYCSLGSRVCLASQFAYLERSAADGKTISEIAAEHADSPEQEAVSFEEQFKENYVDEVENHVQTEYQEAVTKEHSPLSELESNPHAVDVTQSVNHTDVDLQNTQEGILEGHEHVAELLEAESKAIDGEILQQDTAVKATEDTVRQSLVPDTEQADDAEIHDENEAEDQGEGLDKGDKHIQQTDNSSSASSHTVEGENDVSSAGQEFSLEHIDTVDNAFEYNDNEDQDEFEDLGTAEDLFSEDAENDVSAKDQENNTAPTQAEKDMTSNSLEQVQANFSNGTTDYDQQALDESTTEEAFAFNADEDTEEFDFLGVDDTVSGPPITPSKIHGGKRKAFEEEEELDFNEISTPEPKRTRAS